MIAVTELTSYRPNSSAFDNDLCISHAATVRTERTLVNVENVRTGCNNALMKTIGEILSQLREVADLTLDEIAHGAGYKGRSSVQRYFDPSYDGPLSPVVARKLADGFRSSNIPESEIMALAFTGLSTNAEPFQLEGASTERLQANLPIYGGALGAEKVVDGHSIELATLNTADIIEYKKRPSILNGRKKAYGLYVQGHSMSPVHEDGSIILAERDRPIRSGDSVVVYLRVNGEADYEDDGAMARTVLVKRFVRRTAKYVELMQYEPAISFKIPANDVLHIDRVYTIGDLLD